MIRSIKVAGFKSLFDQTIELGRLNLFVGANGAGKSCVLEAIGLLGAAADGIVDDAALLRRGVRPGVPDLYKSAFADATVPRVIVLGATSDDEPNAEYAVSLDNPLGSGGSWRFNSERVTVGTQDYVTRSPRAANFWRRRVKQKIPRIEEAKGIARLPSPFGPPPASAGRLLDSLRDYAIYDPQTPVLRATETDFLQRDPIGLHGGRLAEAVEPVLRGLQPPETDVYSLIDWAKDISVAPPTPDLLSPSIPTATEVVRFVDRFMKAPRNVLSGYDASEGALYVLFTLVLCFHPKSPRFLAIDNFGHALHPRLARRLVDLLSASTVAMKRQILLTTHSPLVLDSLDLADDGIRLFAVGRTEGGHTELTRIGHSAALASAMANGLTLSQMWTQGLLGAVPNL